MTVLLLPLGLFLAWRVLSPALLAARPVSFDVSALSALGHHELYVLLAGALLTQLGPGLLLLAAVGAVTAARRRPRAAALWAFTAAAPLVFLAGIDVARSEAGAPIPVYWGHSRFMLLVLPPVLCFALEAFRRPSRGKRLVTALALASAASNVLLRPIGWDGSRPARWGDVVIETAGERYPYDALYRWAASTHVRGEVRVIGRDYLYHDEFYIRKHGLELTLTAPRARSPRSPDLRRDDAVAAAMRELREELQREAAGPDAASLVVAQLRAGGDPRSLPESLGTRPRLRTFVLGEHALVVYGDADLRTGVREGPSSGRSPRS